MLVVDDAGCLHTMLQALERRYVSQSQWQTTTSQSSHDKLLGIQDNVSLTLSLVQCTNL